MNESNTHSEVAAAPPHPAPVVTFTGKLLNYADWRYHSPIFVETGTAMGDGVQRALDAGFSPVRSCEAEHKYFISSMHRFALDGEVIIIYGRSTDWLGNMLRAQIRPAVIYLDAHPTGPNSYGHEQWLEDPNGEANQHNIIMKELDILLAHRPDHLIIIDDVNGIADGCAEQYISKCYAVNPGYRFEFWDEDLSGTQRYVDKILVCIPPAVIVQTPAAI